MGRYFGTDGFRGKANVTLTAAHAYKIGAFLGGYLSRAKSHARVVIGKDTRLSGDMFESALAAGLTEYGADAYLMHVVTTPAIAHICRTEKFDCGIMISASHNPYFDNGIKLFNGNGEKLDENLISLIEDYIDGKSACERSAENIGCVKDYACGAEKYADYLVSIGKKAFGNKELGGLKIGLDCANGSAYDLAKNVFTALGATPVVINDTPNGLNINENAGSTHIGGLQDLVRQNGLDCGFAFDGDADRCLAVDENGDVVNGDRILYICGGFLKSRGGLETNTVVTTVMSNFGLYKAFDEAQIAYAKTAVGDKYVYEYMRANGNIIGGEQSGHVIFSKLATTGDGILTSIKILEVMLAENAKLSALSAPVKEYPQVLINVRVADKQAAQTDEDVKAAIERVDKQLNGNGRILVRPSGTEPLIRVMVEAQSGEECRRLAESVVSVIVDRGYAEN